jgi:hypothetical protein
MIERGTRTLYVDLDIGELDGKTLAEFLAWAQAVVDRVPAEHRDGARVSYERDYDGYTVGQVQYERPETDEEFERRLAVKKASEADAVRRELAQLAALKAKHEGGQ